VSAIPAPADRLVTPDALLSRTDLRELGLERRASTRSSARSPWSCFLATAGRSSACRRTWRSWSSRVTTATVCA